MDSIEDKPCPREYNQPGDKSEQNHQRTKHGGTSFVFILLLIKSPAATGQSHSSAKFACPDTGRAGSQNFRGPKRFWWLKNRGRRRREEEPPFPVGLFWPEIRLHCTASIGAAAGADAAWDLCARQIDTGKRFTFAAEFSKKGSGMCEDQHVAALP